MSAARPIAAFLLRATGGAGLALAILATVGCGHKPVTVQTTHPPALAPAPVPPGGVSDEDRDYVATHKPIYTEEGLATWYTAPYKGRRAANGQVFDDRALTAAHRTLPMGSLVVVTNIKNRPVQRHAHH